MMTKQNDTAALTDEQLEGVSGGKHIGPVGDGGRMRVGFRSSNPTPHPSPFIPRPPVGPCVTSGRARVVWPQY